jgi:hypothetical protein
MLDPITIGGWAGIAGSVLFVAIFSFLAWTLGFAIGVLMTAPGPPTPGA